MPCYSGASCRKRCRRAVCVVFTLLAGFHVLIRRRAFQKGASVAVRAGSAVCIVRLGCGGSTRRTLSRVGGGRCTSTFTLENGGIRGVNVGFVVSRSGAVMLS